MHTIVPLYRFLTKKIYIFRELDIRLPSISPFVFLEGMGKTVREWLEQNKRYSNL